MRIAHLFGLTAVAAVAAFLADAPAQAPARPELKQLTKEQRQQVLAELKAGANKQAVFAKVRKMVAANAKKAAKPVAAAQTAKAAKAVAVVQAAKPAGATQVQKPVAVAKPKPAVKADPALLSPTALAALIDEQIDRKLAEEGLTPSPLASDAEFLRRAYLDLTGVIPTADQARAFLDSTAPDKRARLVDELLASPNYGRHLADYWQARLFPRESDNRFVLREPFVAWLADQFNQNSPWDRFVRDLVAGSGTVADHAGVTFFLANRSVDKITDRVSENFLGLQLECAQCHNHPFTSWKQAEYWGVAAFFSKVAPDRPKNANRGGDNMTIGVKEGPAKTRLRDFFPESAKDVPPKFFGGAAPALDPKEPYRPAFAEWLTAPDNPYFARAAVNRTWAFLFGEGFVNPVDDMHDANPASHPELLAELSRRFAHGGYDMKALVRGICLSRAYQRTSRPASGNEDAEEVLFARQAVKVMTPEQLFDSLTQVIGAGANAEATKKRTAANPQKQNGNGPRDQFVQFFLAGADEANRTEYEAGIPQALKLMNSRFAGNPAVARGIVGTGTAPAQAVERLYLATLSRRPTDAETARLTDYVRTAAGPNEAYADVLWALLNSTEFTSVR